MILNLEKIRRDRKLWRKKNLELFNRLSILLEYTKIGLEYEGCSKSAARKVKIDLFCNNLGVSLRTIQRWKKAYTSKGIKGLVKKLAPGKQAKPITGHTAKLITEMRKNYRWGAEVIAIHLLKDHHIDIKKNRIERFLTRTGLREKYPCTTKKKTREIKEKPHIQKVKVETPGKHTQVDVKFAHYVMTFKYLRAYVYNFIDHASNWSFKKAYTSYGKKESEDFFNSLIKFCPFEIERLQSDGGHEFTSKYYSKNMDDPVPHPLSEFCKKYEIRHVVIPPGEKELQGLVERSHRQDDQEFYSRAEFTDINKFNEKLREYCDWRNSQRRFKKLDWKSPEEWLREYYTKRFVNILRTLPGVVVEDYFQAA
jgi:transposase